MTPLLTDDGRDIVMVMTAIPGANALNVASRWFHQKIGRDLFLPEHK
jgi:hypothetical protein